MEHEKLKVQSVKQHTLDKTVDTRLSLGSYKLPGSADMASFFKEAAPVLGNYIGKGAMMAKGPVSADSPLNRKQLSFKLKNEIYPKLSQAKEPKEMDLLLKDLYTAYPESRKLMDEVRGTFGTGGAGVMAIPPVIVAAVVVYAIGYAIGYATS